MPGKGVYLVDGERASSTGDPDVLFVIVILRVDLNSVSYQVGRVETHTELSDHADVSSGSQSLHEGLGAGFGDCTWSGTVVIESLK